MEKRYLIELGYGADLHGGDVTKATKKAVKDAMSHCCMAGIADIFQITEPEKLTIKIKVGCPNPDQVNRDEIVELIPFGKVVIEDIVPGGLSTQGLHVGVYGSGDQIVVAVVSLTIFVEI